MDLFQLLPVLVGALLYALRVRGLRRRGTPLPAWKPVVFGLGVLLLVVSLTWPLEELALESFAFHMVQHLLLGDLAALCIVASLTGPVLRPLLSVRAVRSLRVLSHPLVALPLWAANLYVWHLPFLYEAALRHDAVHALEHVSFFAAGVHHVVARRRGAACAGMVRDGLEDGLHGRRAGRSRRCSATCSCGPAIRSTRSTSTPTGRFGLSAAGDQGIAGAVMMVEGSLVTLGALAWLFLRLAAEGELRQELLERGLDPRAVRRAVRYGRAEDMAK